MSCRTYFSEVSRSINSQMHFWDTKAQVCMVQPRVVLISHLILVELPNRSFPAAGLLWLEPEGFQPLCQPSAALLRGFSWTWTRCPVGWVMWMFCSCQREKSAPPVPILSFSLQPLHSLACSSESLNYCWWWFCFARVRVPWLTNAQTNHLSWLGLAFSSA